MQDQDQESLNRLMMALKTVFLTAYDYESVRKGLENLSPVSGIAFKHQTYISVEDQTPDNHAVSVITFASPLPAREWCRVMEWTRPYAFSGDAHQTAWDIGVWSADLPDTHAHRIVCADARIGRWHTKARLSGRPPGALPDVACGASPAYDLKVYPAEIVSLTIRWLHVPPHPHLAVAALGEMTGWLDDYWVQGMEEGPVRSFQDSAYAEGRDGQWAMEGLHTLAEGDRLTIYAPNDTLLWSGTLRGTRKGWLGLPHRVHPASAPPEVAPDVWQQWFTHKPPLSAILRPVRR